MAPAASLASFRSAGSRNAWPTAVNTVSSASPRVRSALRTSSTLELLFGVAGFDLLVVLLEPLADGSELISYLAPFIACLHVCRPLIAGTIEGSGPVRLATP